MKYRSEAAFSAALIRQLNTLGMVQRIESATTGVGIPDIYFRNRTSEYWIELKNMPRDSVYNATWNVPWRKGQRAWALQYMRASGKCTYTIIAFKDGYAIIPMLPVIKAVRMTELKDITEYIRSNW
jgi:hypothetical protein